MAVMSVWRDFRIWHRLEDDMTKRRPDAIWNVTYCEEVIIVEYILPGAIYCSGEYDYKLSEI